MVIEIIVKDKGHNWFFKKRKGILLDNIRTMVYIEKDKTCSVTMFNEVQSICYTNVITVNYKG